MDGIHGPSFNAYNVEPMTSQLLPEDQSQGKSQKEQSRKTLMDRVLVTPIKSGRSSSFRSSRTHPKPTTPSRTLRQHSQRISSGHAFAPYPKRSDTENVRPPKTPSNKLRRTLSDRGYLSAPTLKILASPSKKVLLTSRRHLTSPPKRSSKRARRLSRSGPPLMKTQSDSSLNASRWSGPSIWHADGATTGGKHSVQDIDLELEFQALQLKDNHEATTTTSMLSASIPDCWGEGVHNFVTRLRSALAEEIEARKQAECQLVQERQRRIEMEDLVIQLQREREEYSNHLSLIQQPVSSSPLLLPSSPCASSRIFLTQ